MLRVLPFAVLLAACKATPTEPSFAFPDATGEAIANYAAIVEATYADAQREAEALDIALEALVATPSAAAMRDAQDAWRTSRVPYLQTEVFRFYEGPIDNGVDGPEGLLNAWPLDENYIDYVEGNPDAGIINGSEVIDAATLEGLNEVGGEKNIATGYHAIEFLLWGQDRSTTGPGDRPHTDYVTDGTGTAANQERRGTYLLTSSDLLVGHLTSLTEAWAPGASYRADFEADPEGSFAKILTGMIILSGFETGGERLQAALDSGDREDEHSCFSDNTKVDMVEDVRGVQNVWLGRYGPVSGTSIEAIVREVDPSLADEVTQQIQTSLDLANALQDPFEAEIMPGNTEGNARVRALINALRAQEGLLQDVFQAFELAVPVAD